MEPQTDPKAAYDKWHAQLEIDADCSAPWHTMLKAVLPPLAGLSVLEIACGRGGLAAWLGGLPASARPGKLTAADFSSVAVERAEGFARSRGISDIRFERADLMQLWWPTGSFDVVISCESIEHTPVPRRAIGELARVLKPGGRLFLTCPNFLGVMGLYRVYRRLTGRAVAECGQPIDHALLWPVVFWELKQAGLRVQHRGAGHYLPIPGRPPLRIQSLDRVPLFRMLALHSMFICVKPDGEASVRSKKDEGVNRF